MLSPVLVDARLDKLRDVAEVTIPVMEQYEPPYFFKGSARPTITQHPSRIEYKHKFEVDFSAGSIIFNSSAHPPSTPQLRIEAILQIMGCR